MIHLILCILLLSTGNVLSSDRLSPEAVEYYKHIFEPGVWMPCGGNIQDKKSMMRFPTSSRLHQISMNESIQIEPTGPCRAKERVCNTDKGTIHAYTHYYAAYLEKYQYIYKEIAEVGVNWGGSVRMWLEYFQQAIVHGIDIKKKDEILPMTNGNHANLRLHVANQLVIGDVKDALENSCLDLFIDDGGHTNRMQENTMKDIWKSVRPGGYLIMEDLHTSYRGSALKNNHIVLKPPNHTTLQLITNLVDGHFDVIDESWSTLFSDLNVEHSTCGVRVTFYGDNIPRRTVTSLLKKKCDAKPLMESCKALPDCVDN